MLEAAGGGGGTPWESMTIEKMQSLIQNPDTDKQWDLVDGWNKSAELLNEHRSQVQNYRDNLAAAWPPEKSAAAKLYLDRLDTLLSNLDETYEASLANHDAISSATGSIYQAQVQMEKIYQEYQNNETSLNAYNAKQQEQTSTTPSPSPSPSPSGEEPPVAPGRQEQLRLQAVTLLSSVSSELAQAQVRVVKPSQYTQFKERGTESDPGGDDTYTASPIPFITPSTADSTSTKSSQTTAASFPTSHATAVTSPVATSSGSAQPGLVLGGTTQTLPTTSTTSVNAMTGGTSGQLASPGLLSPSSGLLPGGGQSLTPNTSGVGRGVGTSREGVVRSGTRTSEGGMRASTTGGVIGGVQGSGVGQTGSQTGSGRAGVRRVNPVGGVIGEDAGALGSRRGVGTGNSSAAEHSSGTYGQGPGRRSGRRERVEDSPWDPDNPWQTAEGVDPVVLPSHQQRIDPGPAIGLG